jgi:putative transposase
VERFQVVVHAYVLMDNHYHLLLELRQANLSRTIQWLNVAYSIWFNRRHGRTGHLFQGRFKSVVVEERAWGLGLSRYLHLNPVRIGKLGLNKSQQQRIRAGAAGKPAEALVRERLAKLRGYRWSSYRSYIGVARAPEWLECGAVLRLGGGRLEEQRRNYRNYVETAVREGLEKSPWEELKEQVVLGSQEFVVGLREQLTGDEREQRGARRLREQRPDLSEVVGSMEEAKGEKWEAFRDRHGDGGRDMVLYLGRQLCGAKLDDLARLAGLKEYGAVAMAIKRFKARLARRKGVPEEWRKVNQMLHVKM